MELFDRYFTCLYLHKLLRVVLCSISWVVGIFGSIFSIFSWEIYNLATLGLLGGLGTMLLANVREALLACRKTRTDKKTGKNFLNACVEKIAPPVLQALAFASIILPALQYFETSLIVAAWSGLFFVWEGIIICGLNNKTAALSRNWNAIFKILASVSFWAVSGNFDPGIIFEQIPASSCSCLGVTCPTFADIFPFHAQKSVFNANSLRGKALPVFFSCMLPVGFLAYIDTEGRVGLLLFSSVLLLWSLLKLLIAS